jgi:hypothetical protein
MNTLRPFALFLLGTAVITGCKKEDPVPPTTPPTPSTSTMLLIEHHVDGVPLTYNTIEYTNEIGHEYSVTRLEYYISGIRLISADCCDEDPVIPGPFYINGTTFNSFDVGTLPAGTYTGIELYLGLTPDLNLTGALPATLENVNMAWPVPMGGGYHFMKFEGHFLHNDTPTGYAMHLGRNENLPLVTATKHFSLSGTAGKMALRFNLNEVFRDPHTYDLPSGSQSMGSMMLMGLLRDNCANAFTLELRP